MACNLTITVPDATAVVKDSQGNILATELIASGESKDIIVEANAMINVLKGDFTGEFDLSVQDQNGFYNDYESATIINTLSIAANPTLGALATVRIIGGSLAADAVPVNWAYSGDTISQDTDFYNEIMILYVSSTDVRIVNRLVDAPDVTAPLFAVAPASANIAETSFDITATLDENGTVYGYLLADGAAAPDTDTVIANAQDSFADVGSGGTLSFTGLVVDTNYDVYVVAEDTAGNKQSSPVLVEVLTESAIPADYTTNIYDKWIAGTGELLDGSSLVETWNGSINSEVLTTSGTGQRPPASVGGIMDLSSNKSFVLGTNFDVLDGNLSFFFRIRKTASAGLSSLFDTAQTRHSIMLEASDGNLAYDNQTTEYSSGSPFVFDSNFHTVGFIFAGTTCKIRLDGVQLGANITIPDPFILNQTNVRTLFRLVTATEYFNGELKEFRLYTEAVSDANAEAVEANMTI